MTKLKWIIFISIAFFQMNVNAQVKIGASPTSINANSLLELEQNTSAGKYGLRLPRVALAATNNPAPLSAHVLGMTVYDTVYSGTGPSAVVPGIYYNDGTQWIRVGGNNTDSTGYYYYIAWDGNAGVVGYNALASYNPLLTMSTYYSSNGGSDYNATSGEWICPRSGVYRFVYSGNFYCTGSESSIYVNLKKNGSNVTPEGTRFAALNYKAPGNSIEYMCYVNAGDMITLQITATNAAVYSPYMALSITQAGGGGGGSAGSGSGPSGYVYFLNESEPSPTGAYFAAFLGFPQVASKNMVVGYSSNSGSDYNAANGIWTCPAAGVYKFEYQCAGRSNGGGSSVWVGVFKNGVSLTPNSARAFGSNGWYYESAGSASRVMSCDVGDQVSIGVTYMQGADMACFGRTLSINKL